MGEAISLRVRSRRAALPAPKVAGQIETPRPPDPIMRRPCANREEKRVTHGKDMRQEKQLDPDNPNQRRLSGVVVCDTSACQRGR